MKEKELLAEERALEAEILERQQELQAVRILLNRIRKKDGLPPSDIASLQAPTVNGNDPQTRVRGTLKAAKTMLPMMAEEFKRADLLTAIEMFNPALAGKVRPDAMRSVIRTLMEEGKIEETLPGTKDVPAKYKKLE